MTSTASTIIPKPQCKPRLPEVPWFTEKCNRAIKERKKERLVFRQPHIRKYLEIQLRVKAHNRVKNAKRNCWKQFCSNLKSKTSTKTVWRAICNSSCSFGHLLVDDHVITDKQSVANSLARSLADTSSPSHYSSQFQKLNWKEQWNLKHWKFNPVTQKIIHNLPFSTTELKEALQKFIHSATGPDKVHYNLLTHLPQSVLPSVESITIWESGILPPTWREAVVVPIAKPGKDPNNPTNYRPIALTKLSLQDQGAHGKCATDVVPGAREPFIRHPVWFS